jgi:hypothetical protein
VHFEGVPRTFFVRIRTAVLDIRRLFVTVIVLVLVILSENEGGEGREGRGGKGREGR